MDTASVKRYINLNEKKQELKRELELVEEELQELEQELFPQFQEDGVKSISLDGYTVYVQKMLWAKAVDGNYARACAALERAGLGEFVERRFNVHTLSSFVRELERNGQDIPAEFAGAIDVATVYALRVRKS